MKIRTKSFESLAPPLETKHSLCNRLSLAIRNGHRMRAIGGTSYGGAGRRIQRHQLRKNRAAQLLRKVGGFDHLYLRSRRRSAPASVLSYANNADLGLLIGVHRRETYEPRMVLVFFSACLFLGDHLRRSRLAAGVDLAGEAYPACRAA